MERNHSNTSSNRRDIYQEVTNRILAQMEQAQRWEKPWRFGASEGTKFARPINIRGKAYRGINVPLLWSAGFNSAMWGTYKAWHEKGCQVRKGERGTQIVFWKSYPKTVTNETTGEDEERDFLVARGYVVFNAEQVDGYSAEPVAPITDEARNAQAERFIAASKAVIRFGGNRAYYTTGDDHIQMPPFRAFVGSSTSSAAEAFYGTLLHELTHWCGHPSRCAREFGKRFGDKAYAFEELVAETGAAMLCADLGISNEPRQDHANYLASWIEVLRTDKRAIFSAASKAEQSCKFLHGLAGTAAEDDDNGDAAEPSPAAPEPVIDPEPVPVPVVSNPKPEPKPFVARKRVFNGVTVAQRWNWSKAHESHVRSYMAPVRTPRTRDDYKAIALRYCAWLARQHGIDLSGASVYRVVWDGAHIRGVEYCRPETVEIGEYYTIKADRLLPWFTILIPNHNWQPSVVELSNAELPIAA